MKFVTTILQFGNNTGIEVPPEVRDALGGGKNPLVRVTLAGHTYQSKIATMGGRLLVSVSSEVRGKTGVKGGEAHEVELVLDDQPRIIAPPADLEAALAVDPAAQAAWDRLAPSRRKAHVTVIEEAKSPETRARRVAKAIESILAGK
jgi:hypothetical protein